jgi:hypothetical protein
VVSISNNVDISVSGMALNSDVDPSDTEIEFTDEITGSLDVNSYFTLNNYTELEIMKVEEVVSSTRVRVLRGQLDTIAETFSSSNTDIFLPVHVYF